MAGNYIKREDAVKIAEKYGLANGSVLGRHTGLADCIASEISGLPAADVAEVVHCKDCKHKVRTVADGIVLCAEKHGMIRPTENDFCSYGEYQTNSGGAAHE